MSPEKSPQAPGRAPADLRSAQGNRRSIAHAGGARKKKFRVLAALLARPSINRFQAEKDPDIHDHTLPSTISELQKSGIPIERRIVAVAGFRGGVARVAEYSLPPSSRMAAERLLGGK